MLPDVLGPNLKLVFCGTAVGNRSAQVGAYYADKRNKFWRILNQVGLTERLLLPHEYRELLKYGIGLSDLVKRRAGVDGTLSIDDYDVPAFRAKIAKYQPRIVCFNGKSAAKVFLQNSKVNYGLQIQREGKTLLYVAPSTSGAANGFWDATYWESLADLYRSIDVTDTQGA